MHEKNIILKTKDGNLDCKVFINSNSNAPTIIFYMDAPGIREELRNMCRRILNNGYNVILPNLFYRGGTEGNYPFNQLIYKKSNLDQNNYYLTEIEYKKGKKIFNEIVNISKLSELEIEILKKDVLKINEININALENNLVVFEKKYRRVALKELNKLKEILQELN